MRTRKSTLSPYHVLLVIGKAMASVDGRVCGLDLTGGDPKQRGYIYLVLKKMAELGLLTREPRESVLQEKAMRGTQVYYRKYYELTPKGRRYGEEYNARVIATNPPLIPIEEFE